MAVRAPPAPPHCGKYEIIPRCGKAEGTAATCVGRGRGWHPHGEGDRTPHPAGIWLSGSLNSGPFVVLEPGLWLRF